MTDYANFYKKLTSLIRTRPKMVQLVKLINYIITRGMPLVYAGLLFYICYNQESWQAVLPYILIPGLSFVLLSLVRKFLNQPRPYEAWAIHPLIIKKSKGQSMPSRHVFSATVISVCILHENLFLGLLLLLLSALLALCRVLGGVHYPKDVIIGYLIGLAAGSLLFWS